MDCSIAALIACFSWSGFYVDAGLSWQDSGEMQVTQIGTYDPNLVDDVMENRPYAFTDNKPDNPYVDIGAGYEMTVSSVRVSLEFVAHRSSIKTGNDLGFNYARLGFRWFPLR